MKTLLLAAEAIEYGYRDAREMAGLRGGAVAERARSRWHEPPRWPLVCVGCVGFDRTDFAAHTVFRLAQRALVLLVEPRTPPCIDPGLLYRRSPDRLLPSRERHRLVLSLWSLRLDRRRVHAGIRRLRPDHRPRRASCGGVGRVVRRVD